MKQNTHPPVSATMLLALAALWWLPATATAADSSDTKEIFLAQKCNLCHEVSTEGIARKSEKVKGPDLSDIGARRDAEWIERFLLRKELVEGKEHKKEFKGTKKELAALVKWLVEHKEAPTS